MVKQCAKCGSTRLVPGHVTAVGFRFVPAKARLFYATPVGVAAVACFDCGFLETYVSKKQLAAAVSEPPKEDEASQAPADAPKATEILENAEAEEAGEAKGEASATLEAKAEE